MEEFEQALEREDFYEKFEIPETVDIPEVSERDYDAETPQKLPVEGVVIEGVVPYPEHGITQDEIQALIDRKFREERAIELDINGFTERDLREIGARLRAIADRGYTADMEDMNEIVQLMQEQEVKRGWLTIEQLDSIALSVTEYYRENGFILATAFIPEQEVSDGIIRLNVLEGRLGEVTVSDNEIFSENTIARAFNGELGEPVTEERIESALRRINDLPGIRVRGSFSPGENVGETSLNLGVLDEKAWTSSVLMDNHGAEATGEARLFATTEWLNIRNKGHRLLLGALRSEGPDSATYGLAEYELPVTRDGRGKVRASISSNEFAVASLGTLEDIVGETNNFGVLGNYQFVRGRTLNVSAQLGYTQKDVLFTVADLISLSTDQKIEVLSVASDYTQLWDEQQLLLSGRFGIDQGHIISGEALDQSVDFTKLLLNANLLKRFSFDNWLTKDQSFVNFVAKLNGQYSEQFLSSVEQFSLGGPNAVRAFGVSDVSVDSGIYAGFELFFDLPVDPMQVLKIPLEPLRPFVFFDYGYGVARTAGGTANLDAVLKGYGMGVRINWQDKIIGNLIFATPKSAKYEESFSDAQGESRIYFDVIYQVH
ncbi:MAG: ShlB/FhaC/HecB family hemolysin secretion/activation protein [Pseudomonadales bacterium]|nr:ShlB/FhaC/HecB family hemolysin secretion/activation protein [Pseudomonadales bacterium]